MKVYAIKDFKHGQDRYKKWRVYKLDNETGDYFVACGWAVSLHDIPEGLGIKRPGLLRRLFRG